MQNRSLNSMFLKPTNEKEIRDVVANLKNTNSLGCDNFSNKIIKDSKDAISNILSHIINQAMVKGVFPDYLKTAKIIPIFKSENAKLDK